MPSKKYFDKLRISIDLENFKLSKCIQVFQEYKNISENIFGIPESCVDSSLAWNDV